MWLLYFLLLIPIAVVNLGIATFFLDFKMFYNARFGRKKEPKEEITELRSDHNGSHSNGVDHSNGYNKNTSELAVFEQFERQERPGVISNGGLGRPQRPLLPEFDSAETRTLAETLCRDIIRGSPDVKWESIKGLENAKRLLKEAVVMPIKYPKYFTGLLSPWKGILLFGPPGTGKGWLGSRMWSPDGVLRSGTAATGRSRGPGGRQRRPVGVYGRGWREGSGKEWVLTVGASSREKRGGGSTRE